MDFYLADDMTEYETSRFGIREPKMEDKRSYIPNERDSIFVAMPGAVYDKKGNRIGYGGGYYDKYLQGLADLRIPSVCKVAIAYECQLVECGLIEKEAHDIKVDYIVTEDFLYKGER